MKLGDYRTIDELERQIAALPGGSIAKKHINGKTYYYHRTYVDGKRKERYVAAEDVEPLRLHIEERRRLVTELKALRAGLAKDSWMGNLAIGQEHNEALLDHFQTNVLVGNNLISFARGVEGLRHRECFERLWSYLTSGRTDRVFVLYGLRRTGKTTLIRQALLAMSEASLSRTAFLQMTAADSLAKVNADLRRLREAGFSTVFIDEATLMADFVEGAALFSDIFAAGGMHVVLSGTDSLGFLFAQDEQLYDRCTLLHTTFIPYREFEHVLGITGIDEYIKYGGTMSMGGIDYNHSSTFSSARSASAYVDSAIARNIQHSLKCYQYGGHFRALRELYDANELTGAINRVVEDVNHRFAIETLTRRFKSHDLALSARNLRNDRSRPTNVLDHVDVFQVTARLVKALEIREANERRIPIEPAHVAEIKEYLDLLDVTANIMVANSSYPSQGTSHTVVAQPGLRYAQVEELVSSLLLDDTFADLALAERSYVTDRIRSEVMGRMMKDIVLLETTVARPDAKVFKLQFAIGEFDMVVFDPLAGACEVYEIKHSTERHPAQYRHLVDAEKREATEFRYGPITKTAVIYRGEDATEGDVLYLNVEKYLNAL